MTLDKSLDAPAAVTASVKSTDTEPASLFENAQQFKYLT